MTEQAKLPPGPWSYRPNMHDDWGFVRDSAGAIVAHTCPVGVAQAFTEATKRNAPEWDAGPEHARAVAEFMIRAEREADMRPADIEWLEGLRRADGGLLNMLTVRMCEDGTFHLMAPGKHTEGIEGLADYVSPHTATRGTVRKLASALGIELTESNL